MPRLYQLSITILCRWLTAVACYSVTLATRFSGPHLGESEAAGRLTHVPPPELCWAPIAIASSIFMNAPYRSNAQGVPFEHSTWTVTLRRTIGNEPPDRRLGSGRRGVALRGHRCSHADLRSKSSRRISASVRKDAHLKKTSSIPSTG